MARSRVLLPPLVLGVLGTFAVGCGASGYQYVENEDLGVFARVPDSWTMYDEGDVLRSTDENITDIELEQLSDRVWFRGFDSSNHPSVDGIFDLSAAEPRGFMRIQQLSMTEREQVNLTSIRGFDPLAAITGQTDSQIEVLVDEPADFEGYHGVHTVFAQSDSDGQVAIVDQTAVLDSTSSVLFLFLVGCEPECYDHSHHDEIAAIVDSWTIQGEGT